jgi:hypothetical protein
LGTMLLGGHSNRTRMTASGSQFAFDSAFLDLAEISTVGQVKKHGHSRIDFVYILTTRSAASGYAKSNQFWIKVYSHKRKANNTLVSCQSVLRKNR